MYKRNILEGNAREGKREGLEVSVYKRGRNEGKAERRVRVR